MNDLPVGRSVDETLRLVQAFQYTDKHGEVCPAGWKPGQDTVSFRFILIFVVFMPLNFRLYQIRWRKRNTSKSTDYLKYLQKSNKKSIELKNLHHIIL